MPAISIKDDKGKTLLDVPLGNAGLGKYLKSAVSLRTVADAAKMLGRPLTEGVGGREIDLSVEKDVPIGRGGELTIGAAARAAIGLHAAGTDMLAGGDLQDPVVVPNGSAFTSLTLEAVLKAGLTGTAGALGFGFKAGTALRYRYFQPFDVAGGSPTVQTALETMLTSAVYPADADDLARMASGALVSIAGEGEISFHGEATLSSTTNLLATPGLPIVGTVALVQTASVNVGVDWTASGAFELRIAKLSDSTLRLSYHRRHGRSLDVSATASAGVSVPFRDRELLSLLMRAISSDPEADLLSLVDAGLDDETIGAIQAAVAASIDRSLTLSAQLQVSSLRDDEAIFAYEIDLARLDADGVDAVGDALHGRLTALGTLAAAGGPVRLVASAARRLRERRTTWRLNFLGILNVAGFTELVRDGTVTVDEVTGAFTAADRISGRRIRIEGKPLASDPEKLRKVLFEALLVTAAYQASRALGTTLTLTSQHTYLEQRAKTKQADLADHYRALIALGLTDAAERDARLGADSDFGRSTFVIENAFDSAACDAMFLDADGRPRPSAHYERLGRDGFLALNPPTDPGRSYRRVALESDAMWSRVRDLGGAIDEALPAHITSDRIRLAVTRGDVFTIVWWATAMARAAKELAAMRTFLAGLAGTPDAADPAFTKAKARLSDALAGVVATTESRFDDPWDMLAMDAAALRQGRLRSVLISNRFAAQYAEAEPDQPVAVPAHTRALRGAARDAAAAPAARGAARQWTDEQLDIFNKHVVNLREGVLSTSGSFQSTEDQVRRIFTDAIPAYARALPAGARPRVLFFAHGGLVEEEEGLLPVLRRRRFWAANNVYPVYFVWETGLKDTIHDIIFGALPTRAERGPLTDRAIEALARNGGKQVWGQMKKSAELGAKRGGGYPLVAGLAGDLWKEMNGALEYHALGHSAGAILHAFFLPLLVAQRPAGVSQVSLTSLHFLAPAMTTDLFKGTLKPLVGSGKPIARLTEYTMSDELEQADASLHPYGKSLLYLVSNAFEDAVPTPILGLQKSLKQDLPLIRFFGLAGTEKVADICFSRTAATASPRFRTLSITHGGFDNDVATMTSVVRGVLDASDADPVTDYFEDQIAEPTRAPAAAPRTAAPRARVREVPGAAAAKAPAVSTGGHRAKWTVMVWMAGDNNLESFGALDLAELKQVGTTDDVTVLAQLDTMADDRTRRYLLRAGGDASADVVQELGETNTGDPAVAVDFFRWGIEQYPADRLLGVIWNHGAGIDDTDIYARGPAPGATVDRGPTRGLVRRAMSSRHRRALFNTTVAQATNDRAIAFDDSSRDFLDNIELKKVLVDVKRQTGRTFDILGFDACLMNMIEIAFQLKGTTDVVVGSEEVEPGNGWPYDSVLRALVERPAMETEELAAQIVDLYAASYTTGSVTQSALALARLDAAAGAVDALAKALVKAIRTPAEYAAVAKALNAAQRFETADFIDIGHLCDELGGRSKVKEVKSAAKAARVAVTARDGFVVAERHKGNGVANATGAAIYFPRGAVNKAYGKLDFAKRTSWRTFLDAFHDA